MTAFCLRFASLTGLAVIVLLGLDVVVPSRAAASCGDYVTIGGQRSMTGQVGVDYLADPMHHQEDAGTNGNAGTRENSPANPTHRTPCQGPSCSNGSFPPVTPPPKISVSVERWACELNFVVHSTADDSLLCTPEGALRLAESVASGIFRPPRYAA